MKYTKKFEQDIERLRVLKVKNRKGYAEEFKRIEKEYGISRATVCRHLNKKIPGLRKTRADIGKEKKPLTQEQETIVTEAMLSGKKKKEALKIAEEKTGRKITSVKAAQINQDREIEETHFGSEAKQFIRKIVEGDLIAPEAGMWFKSKSGVSFKVRKEYIDDIILVLSTAYNESLGDDTVGRMQIDREQVMRTQIYHLVQEAIRIAKERFDMKLVAQLTRMYKELKETVSIEGDLNYPVFVKCIKELRPEATRAEVNALIVKHSKEADNEQ